MKKIKNTIIIIIGLFFMLNFSIVISKNNFSDFELFGYKFKIMIDETFAGPVHKYKMSMGGGCICPGQTGGYWVSCHLPSLTPECSIMQCTCFEFPISGY